MMSSSGCLEEEAQLLLCLAHPFREHIGALAHEERDGAARRAAIVGERARDKGLPRARWPVE